MNMKKLAIGIGIAAVLVLALVGGGWFVTNAYAQALLPNANAPTGGCHDNQAVFELLKTNAQDLYKERQSGQSLLDIATAKGVSEQQLTDALLQPMTAMHNWMGQYYPPSNPNQMTEQMTQYMRDQTAKDIRQSEYGTMTDFRLFGGSNGGVMGSNGMMGGYGGMMNGSNGGMMNGSGGMMGGSSSGGMMGGRTN